MTKNQEKHLQEIKDTFCRLVDKKYRKGQDEHGGNLFNKSQIFLLSEALQETIDQATYLITAINQLKTKKDNS